jgi:hypothetical protein
MVHGQFHVCRGAFRHIDVLTAGTKRLIQSTQVELSHGEGTRVKCDKTDPGAKTKRKRKNETEPEQRDAWRQIEDDNGLKRLKDVKRSSFSDDGGAGARMLHFYKTTFCSQFLFCSKKEHYPSTSTVL